MSSSPRPAPPAGLRWVKKRDGREVPFDKAKIARAVRAAQDAIGEGDDTLAGETADLVELELRRRHARTADLDSRGPSIEEIQDLVEEVLVELGRARLAKAYILYRDRRSRAREALAVEVTPELAARAGALRVRDGSGIAPWSKGRIVAALVEETGLPRPSAEQVASRVEERLLRSGLRQVSSVLVRELVAAELVGLGLEGALRRHQPVSLPRHDVRRLLASGVGTEDAPHATPLGIEGALTAKLLERYALDEIFDERSAELHLAGDLELVGLAAPQRYLSMAVPADLLVRGKPGVRAAFELLDELARLASGASRALVLEAPGPMLQPLVRGARADSTSALSSWLLALRALGSATGLEVGLSRIGLRSAALLGRLVEELARLEEDGELAGDAPALYVDRAELGALANEEGLRPSLERLLGTGVLRPTFGREDGAYAGPGCHRHGAEMGALACGGAVAINLARVARRAGPWREDLVLEALSSLAQAGVEALAALARFQRESRASRGTRLRARVGHAIVPVGLVEALAVLGDGELRPAQGARLLGFLAEAAARFSAERGLVIDLDAVFSERAAARFARLDAERARVRQPLLFGGPPVGTPERDEPYSCALAFPARPAAVAVAAASTADAVAGDSRLATGELLATVPTGVVSRLALAGSGSPLDAWELVDERREAARRAEREHVLQPRPTGPRRPAAPLFEPEAAQNLGS